MHDSVAAAPRAGIRQCASRTRAGAICASPPLSGSRYCLFHDERPEIVELMDRARGKGGRRARALVSAGEPPPLELEDADQLRAFERAVLRRLLAGAIAPAAARASVDLARSIYEAEHRTSGAGAERLRQLTADLLAKSPPRWDEGDAETCDPPANSIAPLGTG